MRTGALLAACLMSAGAAAQVPPGRFDTGSTFVPQNVLSARIGRCVVGRDRKKAAAYVRVRGDDPAFRKVLAALMPAMQSCLAGARSATLDPAFLRGGIAEGLLQADDAALLGGVADRPAFPAVRMTQADRGEPVVAMMACAARAQPADAAAMLRAAPGSPEEAAAFRSLVPSLQACAPATGEVRFNSARVRPAVAIALYREVAGS